MTDPEQALRTHVERFNEGVRTGDFGPMLAGFDRDAEMVFEGVPVGPFHGREAIGEAYRSRPPDDEIVVLDTVVEDGSVVAGYAWRRDAGLRAGRLIVTPGARGIGRLVVTFDAERGYE
jgi:steroid Delta-isomerase